jgi:hypothetical protein
LVLAIIVASIVNSLSLVLRYYPLSDHPIIQLRFNALFTAFTCQDGRLYPQLLLPLLLLKRTLSLYLLHLTPGTSQHLSALPLSLLVTPIYPLTTSYSCSPTS